jgi:hypothetical protein
VKAAMGAERARGRGVSCFAAERRSGDRLADF